VGIKHYSDLTEEEIICLRGYLESKTKAKLSIKVDGSANIGFGVDENGNVYVARKVKGQDKKIYDPNDYPQSPQYNAIKTAAAAILNSSEAITNVLKVGDYVNAEVLYESTPNVIYYGDSNYIFMHDERFNGLSEEIFSYDTFVYKVKDTSVDPDDAVVSKISEQGQYIVKTNHPINLEIPHFRHRSHGVILPSGESILSLIDDTLLSQVWPTEAKPFHEGIVIEYPNLIFKVVGDFPKLNKAQWKIREYIQDGYTDEAGWVYGLRYQFFNNIANAIDLPLIKAPSRKHHINSKYEGYNFFDRVLELLSDKEIVVTDKHISDIHTLTTTFINGKFSDVRYLIQDAETYLQPINYRKTLESYVYNKDFYLSVEKFIGSLEDSNKTNNEKLASIICFILKEDIVKDTLLKKVWRILSGKNKQA